MAVILGISAYYHDSAAALIIDGDIVAAAQEERFSRKKNDPAFPSRALEYVIQEAGISERDIDAVVFYEKPFIKFERLLETYHSFAPAGITGFLSSMPVWIKEKVFMKRMIRKELARHRIKSIPLLFPEHHLSHAASAFYPSPYKEAAILTIDGVGEWATTTIGYGNGNNIKILCELHFPHSPGLLYSAFTYYLGFRVNSGEYKLMGLAPYGDAESPQTAEFICLIKENLVDIRDDGSLLMNMKWFQFATGLKMTCNKKWEKLFGFPLRESESEILQHHCNLALAIQKVIEEIMMKLAVTAQTLTGSNNLTMAGGVALNSVANGKILASGIFKNIWIQPAAGDAGGAVGAALCGEYIWKGNPRKVIEPDAMKGALLGPAFGNKDIEKVIRRYNADARFISDSAELVKVAADYIASGKVVGWFQGRMEFGPRALGNRSILGDARNPEMQKKMNLKIKFREGFRPFAPSVLEEDSKEYFDIEIPSPYMLYVIPVKKERCKAIPNGFDSMNLYDKLYHLRSDIPAVTHVDFSARIQSVNKNTNGKYWNLINDFKNITGYGIIINTSFNVRGEPIICTPDDAYRCFMRTEMDSLVIGNYLFEKSEQNNIGLKEVFGED